MKNTLPLSLSAFLLALPLLAGETFLPLQDGNHWTYRERGGDQTFTIRVGTPLVTSNAIYYRIFGYATQSLWVRGDDTGSLWYLDEENSRDVLLTSFETPAGAWFEAPLRECEQQGQTSPDRKDYTGPAGYFSSAVTIQYRSFSCADAGVHEERYAPNIGLLQRTVGTIAGPRVYDLVSARIGTMSLRADSNGGFSVSWNRAPGATTAKATLELRATGSVRLRSLSVNEYDAILRAEDGSVVWQWSEGKVFPASVSDIDASYRVWTLDVPLTGQAGSALPPGNYQLEAWLNSGDGRLQFSATAPVLILPE